MNLKEQTYLWYIVILRLYIGYYLLQTGDLKIPPRLSSERLDQPTDRRPEQGRDICLV
jgi:hypothetical protein